MADPPSRCAVLDIEVGANPDAILDAGLPGTLRALALPGYAGVRPVVYTGDLRRAV